MVRDRAVYSSNPMYKATRMLIPTYNNLLKVAVDFSDAIILAAEEISEDLSEYITNLQKPMLPYVPLQEFEEAYANFYSTEVLK